MEITMLMLDEEEWEMANSSPCSQRITYYVTTLSYWEKKQIFDSWDECNQSQLVELRLDYINSPLKLRITLLCCIVQELVTTLPSSDHDKVAPHILLS